MTAVKVERALNEDHHVLLTIDPAELITALAHQLRARHGLMALMRNLPAEHPEHKRAKRELIDALGDTFQVVLNPTESEELAQEILWAAREAPECRNPNCDRPAESDYCAACLDGGAGTVRRAG